MDPCELFQINQQKSCSAPCQNEEYVIHLHYSLISLAAGNGISAEPFWRRSDHNVEHVPIQIFKDL